MLATQTSLHKCCARASRRSLKVVCRGSNRPSFPAVHARVVPRAASGVSFSSPSNATPFAGDDFYAILGVPPSAETDSIKKAYHALMQEFDPDRCSVDEDSLDLRVLLSEIYETLVDPDKRAVYDTIAGFSQMSLNPFHDISHEADQAFVDELNCIGCGKCAKACPTKFLIDEEHEGRARTRIGVETSTEELKRAMQTCPVDCIHLVTAPQLSFLESALAAMESVEVWRQQHPGRSLGGVFQEANRAWEQRQQVAKEVGWSSPWNPSITGSYASIDDDDLLHSASSSGGKKIAGLAAAAARAFRLWRQQNSMSRDLAKAVEANKDESAAITFSSQHRQSFVDVMRNSLPAELLAAVQQLTNEMDEQPLQLFDLIAKGGYSSVYQGLWRNNKVAVKIMDVGEGDVSRRQLAAREVANLVHLQHPNVVNTYTYHLQEVAVMQHPRPSGQTDLVMMVDPSMTTSAQSSSSNFHISAMDWQLFIVQEFCDGGALRDVIDKELFHTAGRVDIKKVLTAALDIAKGMQHVHDQNIVHGDLNPNNVLLLKSNDSINGFTCKVADFGLSIALSGNQTHVSNLHQGTAFYIAPEVNIFGRMTKSADVFAFGILLWELFHGCPPWRSEQLRPVINPRILLKFSPMCPPELKALAKQCLSSTLPNRPTFDAIVASLSSMLEQSDRMQADMEQALREAGTVAMFEPSVPSSQRPPVDVDLMRKLVAGDEVHVDHFAAMSSMDEPRVSEPGLPDAMDPSRVTALVMLNNWLLTNIPVDPAAGRSLTASRR